MNCDTLMSETIITLSWILLPLAYMVAVYGGYYVGRDAGKRERSQVASGVKEDNRSNDGTP